MTTKLILDGKIPQNRQEARTHQAIHRKKLFAGRLAAHEIHSKYAFPPHAKCSGCGSRNNLQTRAIVLVPIEEMRRQDPLFDTLMGVNPQAMVDVLVPTKYGQFVRISTAYACKEHTPELERALAKAPSYAIVDINRGPKPDRFVSGRAGGSSID